jgi:hypothetical protein
MTRITRYYLPWCPLLINLSIFKIDKDQTPNNLKIKGVMYYFEMYQGIKFNVHQAKGSKDIEWSVYYYIQFDL